jgi:hypothetical protein
MVNGKPHVNRYYMHVFGIIIKEKDVLALVAIIMQASTVRTT